MSINNNDNDNKKLLKSHVNLVFTKILIYIRKINIYIYLILLLK